MNDRHSFFGRRPLFVAAAVGLVLAAGSSPVDAYPDAEAPPHICVHGDMSTIKERLRALSGSTALPGQPGYCGCDPLPMDYPDYVIEVSEYDAATDSYSDETIVVDASVIETEHFIIRYPTTVGRPDPAGGDSVVVTDCRWAWDLDEVQDFGDTGYLIDCSDEEVAAKNAATILEWVWTEEIEVRDYPAPPMPPSGKIDVIIGDLGVILESPGAAGVAEPCADTSEGGPTYSRFFIDSSLTDPDEAAQVVAHEFFHVVQSGIDHKESLAWMESTALWMQNEVAGGGYWGYYAWGVKDYDKPLTNVNPWQLRYGNVVWAQYLAEHYGEEVVRDIWLDAGDPVGDDGMLHHYNILGAGVDGYEAAIHNFRYTLWEENSPPWTQRHSLSGRSPRAGWENTIDETTANYILFEGDPTREDGKFKICFKNVDGKPGLWARLAMIKGGAALESDLEKPAAAEPVPSSTEKPAQVVCTIPVRTSQGIAYADEREEANPWGPAALVVAPDGDFLVADTAARKIRRFAPDGTLRHTIDLAPYRVARADDIALLGDEILVLDTGSIVPRILRLSAEGRLEASYDLPEGLRLEDGLSGIRVDDGGTILVEREGIHVARLLVGGGRVDFEDLPGIRKAGRTFSVQPVAPGRAASSGTIEIDGRRLTLTVAHTLTGLRLLQAFDDGSFLLVVEEAAIGDRIQVDKTVRLYDIGGRLLGMARFPLEEQYTYVPHALAVAPDGQVYALITLPDRVEIRRLSLVPRLDDVLDSVVPAPANKGAAPQKAASQACVSRATIMETARSYVNNSVYLSSTNIDGACSGRGKPVYLGSPGTYPSVPYDWGGFDSLKQFNDYMASGSQAGDVDTSGVESCSKGVDCSGFVSRCWQTSSKYGTSTISSISYTLSSFDQLIAGDAFNRSSYHIMLFNSFSGSGAYVYESTTGGHDRVVYQYRNSDVYNSYTPIRYHDLCDPDSPPDGDSGDDDTGTGDDDGGTGDDGTGGDDGGTGDDGTGGDDGGTSGGDDGGLTGGTDPTTGDGEIHQVSLDLVDSDCDGEYMEVDGFGTDVGWVALIVSFAAGPDTGDMCSGHGAYELCGHKGSNPPCGSATYRYDVAVQYPDQEEGTSCSLARNSSSGHDGRLGLWALVLAPAALVTMRKRTHP